MTIETVQTAAAAVFWLCAAVVVYSYLGFPLLALAVAIFHRPVRSNRHATPRVSLIIAAHNEAASIQAKLENALALDYPRERLEVIVASDGSTDGTNEIARRFEASGVRLLALPRGGKAAALNRAVRESSGDVLVFSDANSMYAPAALRELVAPLADERVGGVAGNQVYRNEGDAGQSAEGEKLYWNFDRFLKTAQSRFGSVVSATGAIYAIRRKLFVDVPEGVTDDFVTSTRIIAQGYRLVFAPQAIALESAAATTGREYGRKVRVITRGLRGVLVMRTLLNPLRFGWYSLQLFSHKLLRRLVAVPLVLLAIAAPLLWSRGAIYQAATIAQAVFYGAALLGRLGRRWRVGRIRLLTVPLYFTMVNLAALQALINVVRGKRIVLWEPQRNDPADANDRSVAAGAASMGESA